MYEIPPSSLRVLLEATSANIPALTKMVEQAQDKLRRETAKAEKLRELIALFEADVPTQPVLSNGEYAVLDGDNRTLSVARATETVSGQGTKKARMKSEITRLLNLHGTMHRSELLTHLKAMGIMGTEADPLHQLSAYLSSERDTFATDGKANFSLRPNKSQELLTAMADAHPKAEAAE